MFEEVALNFFRGLSKPEKKALIKKIFDSLSEEEKLEIAKILTGKK
jgi:phenylpyruvate tautomerase PptA (4-oxalocrotonate tautomerase family)